jgi:hypothetical protein
MRGGARRARVPGMTRLAPLAALAVAAMLPAAASAAAKPKAGTFAAQPAQKGVKGSRLALGVDDKGTITGVGFFWTCAGKKQTDHQTTMLDGLEDVITPKKGSFKATRKHVYTVVGKLPDIETAEATVTITGAITSAKTISGTVVAKVGTCSTGTLKYTATWEGKPKPAPTA